MEKNKELVVDSEVYEEEHSYKGALFSSVVFVGGIIVATIILLIVIYMARI